MDEDDPTFPHKVDLKITEKHPWFQRLMKKMAVPPDPLLVGMDQTPTMVISIGGFYQRFKLDALNTITTDPQHGTSVNTVWRAVSHTTLIEGR